MEVKLLLLLLVDHPIVSNLDSVWKLSEDECCTENFVAAAFDGLWYIKLELLS
ncbi:hypothetical protein L1049_001548 [Liquidambar formosana]|uniref:Uncharacterized protein n=1 Tax=Liquidambar formosana TaxID=63359 RepID=A0AAP0NB30_LIQFO